jgi:hypothetical protein
MLYRVPYDPPPMDGPQKVISKSLEAHLIEICRVIHNYSFDLFAHRATKHKDKLSEIQGYSEQDQTHFQLQDRSKLAVFFRHVDGIFLAVANAQTKKQLTPTSIQLILTIYSYWTKINFLPKLLDADDKLTFLDNVDVWLAERAWSDTLLIHSERES